MVGTRHLQGTIISRVSYLLESGSLKKPPIWYDIVRRFPPPKTSVLSLVGNVEQKDIPKILYPSDDVKREFYQKFGRAVRDPDSLFSDVTVEETKTELFLKNYNELIAGGSNHDDAMTKASEIFLNHLQSLRDQKKQLASSSQQDFPNNQETGVDEADLDTDDIYEMFNSKNRKSKK